MGGNAKKVVQIYLTHMYSETTEVAERCTRLLQNSDFALLCQWRFAPCSLSQWWLVWRLCYSIWVLLSGKEPESGGKKERQGKRNSAPYQAIHGSCGRERLSRHEKLSVGQHTWRYCIDCLFSIRSEDAMGRCMGKYSSVGLPYDLG